MRQTNQKSAIYGQPGGTQKQAQLINQYSGAQSVTLNDATKRNLGHPPATSLKTSSRQRGASQSQITAATSTPQVVQGHNKTKSTQLTSGPNGLQNILQDNSYPQATQLSGNQSSQNNKIVPKHTRHVSGPTSGNGSMQQQLQSQLQTMTASQPETLRVSINLGGNLQQRPQKPSPNVSTIIVNKANSNKIAIQKDKNIQNNGAQKVNQIIDTYADNAESIIHNQSNANAGHKKSVSMANSKITQLLLKAGQGQLQNKQQQKTQADSKPKTKLQKKTKLKDFVLQNENYQNSFEMMKNDGIAKSFGVPSAIHVISDAQIARILTFDDCQINRLEPSYNEFVKFNQFHQNHSGQDQSLSVERTVPVKNINFTKKDKQPVQSKQQLLLTPLQMVLGSQQVVAPKESSQTVYGVEKIKQQSKIVSSVDAVKKPNQNFQPRSQGVNSLGARSSVIGPPQEETSEIQSLNLELNNGAKVVSANHHQRTKSDQLYIQKAINNFGVNAVQSQQKKVGEILKNNFLEVVQSHILNGSAPTAKQTLTNIGSSNTTSANPQLIKSFAIHENNLTSQTQASQIGKKKTATHIQKQVQHDLLTNALKGQLRKSTKEKYNELKQQYDDLAEKYKVALAATQAQNLAEEQNNIQTKTDLSAGKKVDIKSSVSSLSGQTLYSNNMHQPGVIQNKINQRVVRYIHKQRTPNSVENGFRHNQENCQNIKIQNDFEWADAMPVDHDARQVMNPAPINTNSSDVKKIASNEHKLIQSVVAQPPKIILSTREHQDERILHTQSGVQKQRQIISAKQKFQRQALNKTPDSNESLNPTNAAVSKYIKQSEAFTNNVESQTKNKKLELSNRHRRSVSDGNEPSAQLKFNQGALKKQLLQNELDNQLDKQNRILFEKVANRLSDDANKQSKAPSGQHVMWDQIQENWDFEQSVVQSIESVGSFGQKQQKFKNSKKQVEQVVNQINQLRVQHNRLKSDELASNKERLKSNQNYIASNQKTENPANEGNIQTPSLDTLVNQRSQHNRDRILSKINNNVPNMQDLHQYLMLHSQPTKTIKPIPELPNPRINNLIHSNRKSSQKHNRSSSRKNLEEVQKLQNPVNKQSVSEGREMKVNPTQQMVIHRPVQTMQVHPLIQQTLNTHHSKNRLSNTSGSQTAIDNPLSGIMSAGQQLYEKLNSTQSKVIAFLGSQKQEKRIVSSSQSKQSTSNHKRVKSDGVEYRQSKVIHMGQNTHFPSVSFVNLPVKDKNKINVYENDTATQNVAQNVQKYQPMQKNFQEQINPANFFIGANTLDGTSDDRKLVNVSIDLINEDGQDSELAADDQGKGYYQGGQWFEVKQFDGKETSQNAKENFVLQFNQQRVAITDVTQPLKQGLHEYKHRRQISTHSKSSEERKQPSNDLKMTSDQMRLDKYKNMLLKAKNKFQSKSEVPQQIVIQDDFQIDADSSQYFMNTNQRRGSPTNQMSSKLMKNKNHQASRESLEFVQPAMARDPQGNQVNINMVFPARIKSDKAKSLSKEPKQKVIQKFEKTIPEQTVQKRKVIEAKPQQKEQKQEMFVPTNSIAQSLAENQSDLNESMHNFNIIMSQPVDQDFVGDRLLTQDSVNNDPTLSPRQKIIKQLTKYISKQGSACAQSTIDFYRIGKVLGKGAFGKVNLALHHLTKRMVAIKSINKSYFNEESQSTKVKQEVVILKQTRHRNIVRLYEYFETQKHILFVIEICPGGDLLNYVRKRRQLKEDIAKSVFKQLIEGIGYCHSKNILHRDIKLDNILLAWNGEVKICDFGVSKVVRKGEIMTEQCGTPAYIAPEILMDKGYEGFSADIWSAGVVLFAMLYGTVPFKANNMSELQKIIIKAQYQLQDCISKEARNLLEGLLEKDPQKRLTVKQIFNHPWMKDAKETVELFTSAEQNYIKNEYTYANTDRYNRNEPDNFMDGALDTERNSILKNAETKSIILAPFNSTKTHIESSSQFLTEIQEMMQSRSCILFVGKVREIDKQYEVNNNADLDNGVYHDFGKDEEEKANENLSPEKEQKKQTEMQILENMIRKEESQNNFTHGSDEKPYECGEEEGIPNTKQLQPGNSKKLMNKGLETNEAEYFSSHPSQNAHGLMPANTLTIDSKIVDQVVQYGYKPDLVIKSLNNNELNSATTCYFLLCLPDIRDEVRKLDEIRQVFGQSASSGSLSRKV